MDVISSLLAAQRAEGAFVLRSLLTEPWAMRVEDGAPLTLVCVVRGVARLITDAGETAALGPGDLALVRGPGAYAVAGLADVEPMVRIGPGQVCTTPDGSPLSGFRDLGVRSWGNADEDAGPAPTALLTATYERSSQVAGPLLVRLPGLLVVPAVDAPATATALVDLLAAELERADPGQGVVLDRLVDLLVVALLRSWCASAESDAPRWLSASGDRVVGPALRRLHHEPHRPWTVASLAAESALSRAAFARRFTDLVGEPPMGYLTRWRLDLAADLLRDTDLVLEAVAARVGYASAFSFSAAFSRHRGTSPSAYRRAARTSLAS